MDNNLYLPDQHLDDYFSGKISRVELDALLKALGITDTEGEIIQHRAAMNAIQRSSVLEQVQKVHREFFAAGTASVSDTTAEAPIVSGNVVRMNWRRTVLRIAAVFILVMGLSGIYIAVSTSGSSLYNNMSMEYYVAVARGNNETTDITQAFNRNDFRLVTDLYRSSSNPGQREHFLAGYAYMQTGSYDQALAAFNNITSANNTTTEPLYQDEADYYSGLCLIRQGNYAGAYAIFSVIHDQPQHTYHDEISRLTLIRLYYLRLAH